MISCASRVACFEYYLLYVLVLWRWLITFRDVLVLEHRRRCRCHHHHCYFSFAISVATTTKMHFPHRHYCRCLLAGVAEGGRGLSLCCVTHPAISSGRQYICPPKCSACPPIQLDLVPLLRLFFFGFIIYRVHREHEMEGSASINVEKTTHLYKREAIKVRDKQVGG